MIREDGTKLINPAQFLEEFMLAVVNDPGTERKLMLFFLDEEEICFVCARSEARVMSLEFKRRSKDPVTVEAIPERRKITR